MENEEQQAFFFTFKNVTQDVSDQWVCTKHSYYNTLYILQNIQIYNIPSFFFYRLTP